MQYSWGCKQVAMWLSVNIKNIIFSSHFSLKKMRKHISLLIFAHFLLNFLKHTFSADKYAVIVCHIKSVRSSSDQQETVTHCGQIFQIFISYVKTKVTLISLLHGDVCHLFAQIYGFLSQYYHYQFNPSKKLFE